MPGLPARQCVDCRGVLLDLLTYRQWRELQTQDVHFGQNHALAEADVATEDTSKALLCGKCQRIMTKYRVSGESANRLDFCVHCADVWLDAGELALLDTPNLQGDLGRVFTTPWQQALTKGLTTQLATDNLQAHLGPDLAQVESFSQWLAEHPQRSRILAYLQAQLRTSV